VLLKKSIVALSAAFLVTSASFAAPVCDSCADNEYSKRDTAAFQNTIRPDSQEAKKWWDDYVNSGERNIAKYIDQLAERDHKAATWFLLTGGKYGFSKRKITPDEEVSIRSAMEKVAKGYSKSSASQEGGLEEWSVITEKNHPGHLHLEMIYKEIKDLKKTNSDLKVQLGDLKSELKNTKGRLDETEKKIEQTKGTLTETSQKLLKAEERIDKLQNDMAEETKGRREEVGWFRSKIDSLVLSQQDMERKIREAVEKERESFQALQNQISVMMRAQTDNNAQFTSLVLALQKTQADLITQAAQRDEQYKREAQEREEIRRREDQEKDQRHRQEMAFKDQQTYHFISQRDAYYASFYPVYQSHPVPVVSPRRHSVSSVSSDDSTITSSSFSS
jgi:peptidoglycan hydrolase CwlO-like protein